MLAFGVLVLLFVVYQLWGTGIATRLHQEALRTQFQHELAIARSHHHEVKPTATTTPTTQPLSGAVPANYGGSLTDGQPVGTIIIPKIGVDYVVVQGTDEADLQLGPGHYKNTSLPGQPGNAGIAGHRTTYLHPFYNLNELAIGDPIYVTTVQGRFEYNVSNIQVVDPSDVTVLDSTSVPTLTLTTCNPRYSAAQRLVVQATLFSPPVTVATTTTTTPAITPPPVSEALAGDSGSGWGAAGWGVLALAVFAALWVLLRGRRWSTKLAVGSVGACGLLVLLYFFFQSISPLLPASF